MPAPDTTRADQALEWLKRGPLRAEELAAKLNITRQNAFTILYRLEDRHAIESHTVTLCGRAWRVWRLRRGEALPPLARAIARWPATPRPLGPTGTAVPAAIADARRTRAQGGAR